LPLCIAQRPRSIALALQGWPNLFVAEQRFGMFVRCV
jgi:hypothetical protein